ncbi:hypothetical protein LUZ61_020724 [Rhynchospora tenuis]|uniref:non-specific serine/threonine protein kinase n=1 Tax=Rhynchospora tenuis TaxID=198213 RepID=A0AAD6EP24_9POAL|nr:hypothetical protein LUZ61_020724 [Rhynchospora tenuis]
MEMDRNSSSAGSRRNRKRNREGLPTADEVPDLYIKKLKEDAHEKEPCHSIVYEMNFLASYHLGRELGSGGFGNTHVCTEKATGLKYACKIIDKGKLVSQEDMSDLRNEVSIMKHLPLHENIVEFRGAYEDNQRVYLVMELCEGGELFDKIVDRGFYNEDDAAVTIKAVMQALKVCHEHGVMHRDLKPENLLYTSKEKTARLKAIDFGLSTFFHPGQRFHEQVGSYWYMAPEVVLGNYGQEADIWSAGIILYVLLCGDPPFSYETDLEAEEAIISGVFDYQNGRWSEISEDAKDLVKGMLDRDPRKRLTLKQVLVKFHWFDKFEGHLIACWKAGSQVRRVRSTCSGLYDGQVWAVRFGRLFVNAKASMAGKIGGPKRKRRPKRKASSKGP